MTLYLIRHGWRRGARRPRPGSGAAGPRAGGNHGAIAGRRNALAPGRFALAADARDADPIAEAFGLEPEIRQEVAEVFDPSVPPEERKAIIGPFMDGHWSDQNEPCRPGAAESSRPWWGWAKAAVT